ncbi:cytochrome P450 [Amycolatopsis thermophila]|uniref:Cytochrome P450 n=1 Tax=Amycolatopsis thermophila TaxID=206084 RepID=A0ABU0F705_9PSEU|nr:cytochrome P450 [Amycolatopsis thermophila]MDQ0382792.1 cytochrome P450 [Amycolatopsis thermophila]
MAHSSAAIPDHVPAHLVVDFDPVAGPEVAEFPPFAMNAFRDSFPIFYTPYGGGFWVLTRFADIKAAFQDPETYPQQGTLNTSWTGTRHIPLRLNPPEHHAYRKMLMGMFSPRRLAQMEPLVRRVARERIGAFERSGSCELVTDYAISLPAATFCGLLGLPLSDFPVYHEISWGLVYEAERLRREQGEEAAQKFRKELLGRVEATVADLIPRRRSRPGEDIISFLLKAAVFDRPLTDDEIVNIATLMFFAGTDSTAGMIAYSFAFLAKNPAYRKKIVAEPDSIPTAADELIRYHGFHHIIRDVARDVEVAGVGLKRGDRVLLHTGGANHDPAEFACPGKVDFSRKPAQQLTFGTGIHRCIGAPLAKLELRVALEEFHSVLPEYRITDGDDVEYAGGQQKILPRRVPLSF